MYTSGICIQVHKLHDYYSQLNYFFAMWLFAILYTFMTSGYKESPRDG